VVVKLVASIAWVNVEVTGGPMLVPVETFVAPAAGLFEASSGAFVVVNVHVTALARAGPSDAFAPVVICAVYAVEAASGAFGVRVAVVHGELQVTVAATDDPPLGVSVNVEVVRVVVSIARENVADGVARALTPVPVGVVAVIVGGVEVPCTVHV
jgi:hypothetical protein